MSSGVGEAELLLIPRVDYEQMRQTANRMADALDRATEQAAREMERDLRRGVRDGINQGVRDGQKGFSKLKLGLASIGAAAGALITDSLNKTYGKSEEIIDKIAEKAEKIKSTVNYADAFGIDQGRYASMMFTGLSYGVETDDFKGMVEGWNEGLEDDSMANYKKIRDEQGLDQALLNLFYTAAKMPESERHSWLAADAGMGSDATFGMQYVNGILRLMETGQKITWDNLNEDAGINTKAEAYQKAIDKNLHNTGEVYRGRAQQESKSFTIGISSQQSESYITSLKVQAELEQAQASNLAERVELQRKLMEFEKLQIEYTRKAVDYSLEMFEKAKAVYDGLVKAYNTPDDNGTPNNPADDKITTGSSTKAVAKNLFDLLMDAAGVKVTHHPSPMDPATRNRQMLQANSYLTDDK